MVAASLVPTLAGLWASADARVRDEAGAALACLAAGAGDQAAVAAAALEVALGAGARGDAADRRHAACVLGSLLEARAVHGPFLALDGLGPLVALAYVAVRSGICVVVWCANWGMKMPYDRRYDEDLPTCADAVRGLAHLSFNPAAQACDVMCECGVVCYAAM